MCGLLHWPLRRDVRLRIVNVNDNVDNDNVNDNNDNVNENEMSSAR